MIRTGLVSVTFRKLTPGEIVPLVVKSGLQGIEWGGDIHVPHGNLQRAREVSRLTGDNGLEVAAYGSYYQTGCQDKLAFDFGQVLETALELKAPTIRVWAGDRGSSSADESWWDRVVSDTRRIADMAESAGITISFEYHPNTLTDTSEAALRLLSEAGRKNVRSYWQEPSELSRDKQLSGLRDVLPWLTNVHVYYYRDGIQMPLAEGREEWDVFFRTVAELPGTRYAMLEFVKDESTAQFLEDARTLSQLATFRRPCL